MDGAIHARRSGALILFILLPLVLTCPNRVEAAVITGAAIRSQGIAVELHFSVRGRGLKWNLGAHGQELWIDLDHARLEIPPRPLYGQERPPIKLVRAIDSGGAHVRIVVEVSGKVDYAIARLPRELVIRFARSGEAPDLAAPLLAEMERTRPASRAVMPSRRKYSHLRDVPEVALNASQAIPNYPMEPRTEGGTPHRITQELTPNTDAEYIAPEPVQPAAITPPRHAFSQPLVVIDAGHGGRDPGTSAADGMEEKNVTLEIAQCLRSALIARGVNAELTRNDDTFLSLAERTRLANRASADLFISIHLNSSPDTNTAGIETYYLNNTTDRATIRLARMENGAANEYGAPGQPNLNYILTDLRQGYKANESASLARMIEAESVASVDASIGIKVNALGAKKGPFYVLVGADMPAVLVECGFLSNPGETRFLTTPRYQRALADGIAAAVVHYFNADAAVGNL